MKKLFLMFLFIPSMVYADWHGLSLSDMNVAPIGGRCFVNGQWCGGLGFKVINYQLPGTLYGKPLPQLYLAIDHTYNLKELLEGRGRGAWGPGIGTSVGGLASKVQGVINLAINVLHDTGGPVELLPPGLTKGIDNYLTIEIAGGYRLFGRDNDVTPWEAMLGGRLTMPFDLTAHH